LAQAKFDYATGKGIVKYAAPAGSTFSLFTTTEYEGEMSLIAINKQKDGTLKEVQSPIKSPVIRQTIRSMSAYINADTIEFAGFLGAETVITELPTVGLFYGDARKEDVGIKGIKWLKIELKGPKFIINMKRPDGQIIPIDGSL